MTKLPRIVAILMIVAGVIMIIAGCVTYYLVQRELADEKITVSEDAENFAGEPVEGPLTAYSEAAVIKEHASEIADGLTYAQLDQDDPRRESVMTASFLRASLFTSVVAFGVAILVVGLGILFILAGLGFLGLDKKVSLATAATGPPATVEAAPPAESTEVTDEPPVTSDESSEVVDSPPTSNDPRSDPTT